MRQMPLERYRAVLRAPGVLGLLFVGFVARGPVIAVSAVLTLHVVLTLHMDYVDAGLVATALTVATAAGAPWRGRVIDRLGLRRALLPSIVIGGGTWLVAPWVSYAGLLALAVIGGIFGLPSFAVIRQALAVAVGAEHRRTSLALDSMSVELSFMTGPAIAVVAATLWSTRGVLLLVGVAQTLAGIALWLLNPPVRSPHPDVEPAATVPGVVVERRHGAGGRHRAAGEEDAAQRSRPGWFTPALLGVFASGAGAALVLSGSEVAVVAQLRHLGHLPFTGRGLRGLGGHLDRGWFRVRRAAAGVSPPVVLLGLAVLTLPIGLAEQPADRGPARRRGRPVLRPGSDGDSAQRSPTWCPKEFRGEALGWQGTAMTAGSGLGAPLAGFAADQSGAAAGVRRGRGGRHRARARRHGPDLGVGAVKRSGGGRPTPATSQPGIPIRAWLLIPSQTDPPAPSSGPAQVRKVEFRSHPRRLLHTRPELRTDRCLCRRVRSPPGARSRVFGVRRLPCPYRCEAPSCRRRREPFSSAVVTRSSTRRTTSASPASTTASGSPRSGWSAPTASRSASSASRTPCGWPPRPTSTSSRSPRRRVRPCASSWTSASSSTSPP